MEPKTDPKKAQNSVSPRSWSVLAAKTPQGSPKTSPRPFQERPKTPQDLPRHPKTRPRPDEDAPRSVKTATRQPKTAQDASQDTPRAPKHFSRSPKSTPNHPKMASDSFFVLLSSLLPLFFLLPFLFSSLFSLLFALLSLPSLRSLLFSRSATKRRGELSY